MKVKRKQHSAAFKAQVALAALKGERTVNELAGVKRDRLTPQRAETQGRKDRQRTRRSLRRTVEE